MKQSTTVNTPQHNPQKQSTATIRLCAKIFCAILALASVLLFITIFIGGTITSVATGPFALLLVPIVFIVSCVVEFVCIICIFFFSSIILGYADTVDNIQTITNIIVNEHDLKGADENKNADASNNANGGTN